MERNNMNLFLMFPLNYKLYCVDDLKSNVIMTEKEGIYLNSSNFTFNNNSAAKLENKIEKRNTLH